MLSLQTLTNIESLLMSRSHPLWGEFMPFAQVFGEVQQAKAALMQSRVQPAPTPQPQPAALNGAAVEQPATPQPSAS
jgi:hypothetical protein